MNVLMSSGHLSKTVRKAFAYLLPAALSFIFSVSCSRDEKVIPRDKMAQIYADMLLMDQWIIAHPEARRTADTTLVYEAVFERYGYDSDDYRASVGFYLQDPDRYARITCLFSSSTRNIVLGSASFTTPSISIASSLATYPPNI